MKYIRLLLLINCLFVSKAGCSQEGHHIFLGATYSLSQKNLDNPGPTTTNPSTGIQTGLNYERSKIPFLNIGYTFGKVFKKYPSYGWQIGAEYKSFWQKSRLLQDEAYNAYYNKFGYYPLIEKQKMLRNFCNAITGFFYVNENFSAMSGLNTLFFEINPAWQREFNGTPHRFIHQYWQLQFNFYLRAAYAFNDSFGAYFSMSTPASKQSISRRFLLSFGIDFHL